jgi:GH43 family beta-xylosidase
MKPIRTLISVALCLCAAAACAQNRDDTFTNPLLERGADPWAIYHEGRYYYMHTTSGKLVLWVTEDLTDLRNADMKTIWVPTDPSNSKHLWAPEIHNIDGKWYVYYAADGGNSADHQLYVLENPNADPFEGKFTMKGRISTDPDNNWAIDGSLFNHRGEWYMVWSGWQTRRIDTETQHIYIARMENPWTLASERVLISSPELEWERHHRNADGTGPRHIVYVNEGPQPIISPQGKYVHIVYSASGVWTPDYCLGLLTADAGGDLLDPALWTKHPVPLFTKDPQNDIYCTGHNSFFPSPDGREWWLLYHARDTETKGARSPYAQKIEWKNEYPVLGRPIPRSTPIKKPSGTGRVSKNLQ